MNELKYLVMNPLYLQLYCTKKKELSDIDRKFNQKMEQLKNISLETKRIKLNIEKINNKIILIDI